jgi:hypothetical protein
VKYFSADGDSLSEVDYLRSQRSSRATAVALGVLTGVVVLGICVGLLGGVRWYRRPTVLAICAGAILLGAPAGVGAGLLHDGLYSPYKTSNVEEVRPETFWTVEKYYSHDGDSLSSEAHYRITRQSEARSVLLGVSAGVVLTLAAAFVILWWFRRQRKRARRECDALVVGLVQEYPQVVQATGGAAALHDAGKVSELLRRFGEGGARPGS